MKKLQIILTALLVTLSIHAREGSLYDGRITVNVIELAKKGDQLVVNLIVDIGNAWWKVTAPSILFLCSPTGQFQRSYRKSR